MRPAWQPAEETINYLNEKLHNSQRFLKYNKSTEKINENGIFKGENLDIYLLKIDSIQILNRTFEGQTIYEVKMFCRGCNVFRRDGDRRDNFEFEFDSLDDATRFKKALEHLLKMKTNRKELF